MNRRILFAFTAMGMVFCACTNQKNQDLQTPVVDATANKTRSEMKTYVAIFEIPAVEITRAVEFYEAILGISIERVDMPEMQIGILPYEGQMVVGTIVKGEGYKPSADGVTIYLNGGEDLQGILSKVEANGGKILVPKTQHADESGFFALFLDSEGNKLGLHSPN